MSAFQTSPTESLMSDPSEAQPSLFSTQDQSSPSGTLNPQDVMTPQSCIFEDGIDTPAAAIKTEDSEATPAPTDSDNKPTKKRKSWGQVLPEPKTNLPPRKRAKTDDEKEQRRVERVLRNRRAAQSSRERKRLEVEALEERNKSLEQMLQNAEKANKLLMDELAQIRQNHGISTLSSNITLSEELFQSNQDTLASLTDPTMTHDISLPTPPNPTTVDPSSLSPIVEAEDEAAEASLDVSPEKIIDLTTSTPDMAQHPAAMLSDLQCLSRAEVLSTRISPPASPTLTQPQLGWLLLLRTILLSASATLSTCQRPLMQIAMSLRAGFSLHPSPQILTKIIWLVTLPTELRTKLSISTTSSRKKLPMLPLTFWQQQTTASPQTTALTRGSLTLRRKFLRKILSSSPNLARPLMDATMVAMRLVASKGQNLQVNEIRAESDEKREAERELTECLKRIALPSSEVLMTLLWTLSVEQKRIERKNRDRLQPETTVLEHQPTPTKRKSIIISDDVVTVAKKRRRLVSRPNAAGTHRLA